MSSGFLPTDRSRSSSPTFGSYFQRQRSRRGGLRGYEQQTYADLLGMTEGSIAEALGAPGGTVRKIQAGPEFQAAQTAAEAIPGISTQPNKGAVASIFDFLGRGSSASVGALTGLLGMSREETGEREADRAERGGGFGTAMRRVKEALSGEDQFRFAEFTSVGARKARGEQVDFGDRAFNSALGFVIDTALDPLTYVSFGGSILGRMGASRKVASAARTTLKGAIGRRQFDSVSFIRNLVNDNFAKTDDIARIMRRDMDEMLSNEAFKKRLFETMDSKDKQKELRKFLNSAFDQKSGMDELVADMAKFRGYVGFDISRDVALQLAPDAAGLAYARRGARGLRNWAKGTFGDDFGEAYFKTLPKDIQGGLRIRAPFVRNADGTAKAFGFEGVGAGRLGEKYKFIGKMTEMSERGRDYVRAGMAPILGKISGKNADIFYDAIVKSTGKTVPFASARGAASTYLDYSVAETANFQARMADALFERRVYEKHGTATNLYISGKQEFGDKFHKTWADLMYNRDRLNEATENLDQLPEMEQRAAQAAALWREMLDEIGQEALGVYNRDHTRAFKFMQDYVPRITAKREAAARAARGRKFVSIGTDSDFVKSRSRFASGWGIKKNGDTYVIGWYPPDDIRTIDDDGWREVFEADPTQFMGDYIIETKMALNEQRLINIFVDSGVLARPQAADILDFKLVNDAMVGEELVRALGIDDMPGWLKILEKDLTDTFKLSGKSRDTLRLAEQTGRRIAEAGIDVNSRADFDVYVKAGSKFVNKLDGTSIVKVKGGKFKIVGKDGKDLVDNLGNVIVGTRSELESLAKNLFTRQRTAMYKSYMVDKRQEILDEIAGTEETFGKVYQGWLSLVENVPPDDQPAAIQALVEAGLRQMEKFGRLKGKAAVAESGVPYLVEEPGKKSFKSIAPEFKKWLTERGYMNVQGLTFNPDGTITQDAVERVKDRVSLQMQQMYGSEKLMESLQRMFSVYQKPKSEVARLIKNIYMPFYAMQKTWMTLGRGPGFVFRNVLGGSWNLHITGVGREQTMASAALLTAQVRARRIVKDRLGETIFQQQPDDVGRLMREEMAKIIRGQFAGKRNTFIDGMEDGDALIELWELFHRNGLGGNRNTSRFVGEILGFGRDRGKTGTLQSKRLGPDGKIITEYFEPNAGTAANPLTVVAQDDMSMYEKWMNAVTFDNPWIRNVMSPMAESSEEYLRMAAFLKGAKEMGLEDVETGLRGYGASQWVKASQFDYSDLSDFEQNGLKLLLPFYTWTRYNVPLQVRAAIHEPGLIQQALRIHESLGAMFSDDDEDPRPSYVNDRFGFEIDESVFDFLPESLRPQGDVAVGMFTAEPLTDLNTWLRKPNEGVNKFNPANYLNLREFGQNLNPIGKVAAEWMGGLEGEPAIRNVPTEPAPGWMRMLGLSQTDPSTGEEVVPRARMEILRNAFPQIGMLERYGAPVFGGERDPGRWLTAIVSGVVGLPVSTLDDWKTASEMNRQTEFVKKQLESKFGTDYEYKMEMIRALVKEGATAEFISNLDIVGMGTEEVDVRRAVSAWRMFQRIEALIASGTPEEEIVAALSAYAPDGSPQLDLIQSIWRYVPPADSDEMREIRNFGVQTLEEDQLQELGVTSEDVRRMSAEERARLLWEFTQRG